MSCPQCSSVIVTKDGTTELGGQRFRYSPCGRRFTKRSSSAFSGRAFPDDIIAVAVRWYVRYRLSYAEVSESLAERGILVDQSTIHRWVQRFLALFGDAARRCGEPVGPDWHVDETYARVRERWHYVYRAIDGNGQIVDAYVPPTRDVAAARLIFERAIATSGTTPRRVITDKAATYPPAHAVAVSGVLHRSGRDRTNGIERDHGFLKERLRPMRGLESVSSAAVFMRRACSGPTEARSMLPMPPRDRRRDSNEVPLSCSRSGQYTWGCGAAFHLNPPARLRAMRGGEHATSGTSGLPASGIQWGRSGRATGARE
jgi:IS6 family transposase